MDQITAFSAVAATLNNLGPGLGDVASNYKEVGDVSKWLLCFLMLMGRFRNILHYWLCLPLRFGVNNGLSYGYR